MIADWKKQMIADIVGTGLSPVRFENNKIFWYKIICRVEKAAILKIYSKK